MWYESDFLDIPGGTASHTRMAVLCCLFQVNQNSLVIQNYWRFVAGMRDLGLPVYTIECAQPGEEFMIPQDGTVMRRVSRTVGWHKERLINILARRVPPRFTKLAWLDADVILHNASWAYETERLLDHYHVVQPFSAARWLDWAGRTVPEVWSPDTRCCDGSVAYMIKHGATLELFDHTHPGFAWAMRRDTWLRLGGLCDRVLTMGADAVMLGAFTGLREQVQIRQHYLRCPSVDDWFRQAFELVDSSLYFVPGMVDHLWHGFWCNRQYTTLGQKIFALNHDFETSVVEAPGRPGDEPRLVSDLALRAIYTRYFKLKNYLETHQ